MKIKLYLSNIVNNNKKWFIKFNNKKRILNNKIDFLVIIIKNEY